MRKLFQKLRSAARTARHYFYLMALADDLYQRHYYPQDPSGHSEGEPTRPFF
ncbi:MAG: hypothetical protein JWR80_8838 [Bradyrhizobium sp.]|nr:hypothetical protein [Bradyrhizobium sp.]